MNFLFNKIAGLRDLAPESYKELPDFIGKNLNHAFELRPYQKEAFRNFITYFEGPQCNHPTQVLFHMATGSGKTLIMAGLILYLYQKGYRNFLFFVNLDNIVQKTKENFLNHASPKYLFSDEIIIDGEHVRINEVSNFQGANPDAINICFTTTQGLHSDMWNHKENAPTFDDFSEIKTVLIADEAHHLNVDTRKGKLDKTEEDSKYSWESTVTNIRDRNPDNILLEFTATCDLQNQYILSSYENKIIFDYPLKKFREEKYSKQVCAIRSDVSYEDRTLLALMFSQYRLKVFQDNRLYLKPVVLLKSKTIAESKAFQEKFHTLIRTLSADTLERILTGLKSVDEVNRMTSYFSDKNITFDRLAAELRVEFAPERCISANDDKEASERQIVLNTLESKNNLYRAIFEVKKLDEGWDVLNLFDIVRLYETRDSKNGKPGPATIAEAQLIGRGARYCPFKIKEDDEKYQRKFDGDMDNPLRVCEELYYHCQYDSRYIAELNRALIATGIMPENQVDVHYKIKDSFKQEELFKTGLVFFNTREVKSRKDVKELLPSIRAKEYRVSVYSGRTAMDVMMGEIHDVAVKTYHCRKTIGEIASFNYSIVHAALRRYDVFKFHILKSYFPNLLSIREFITESAYLGDVTILIESREENTSAKTLFDAVLEVLGQIGTEISAIRQTYIGTTDFTSKYFHEVFHDKTRHIIDPKNGGEGISQNASEIRPEWKIDLSDKDWFVFNDNYGTSEEKSFVAYFASHVENLKKEYEKVFLIRNERQLVLYSFDGGERFEPDYLMLLCKKNATGFDQYQIFVEPKGSNLLVQDKWKEDFLLQIESLGKVVKTFADDNEYHVWGFPFYNDETHSTKFNEAFKRIISKD